MIDEISLRSRDTIIGLGEKLACKLMTAILRDRVSPYVLLLVMNYLCLFFDRVSMQSMSR